MKDEAEKAEKSLSKPYRAFSHIFKNSFQYFPYKSSEFFINYSILPAQSHYMKGKAKSCLSTHISSLFADKSYRAFNHKNTVLSDTIYMESQGERCPLAPASQQQGFEERSLEAATLAINSLEEGAFMAPLLTVIPPTKLPFSQSYVSRDFSHGHTVTPHTKLASFTVLRPTERPTNLLNEAQNLSGKDELKGDLKRSSGMKYFLISKKKGRGRE